MCSLLVLTWQASRHPVDTWTRLLRTWAATACAKQSCAFQKLNWPYLHKLDRVTEAIVRHLISKPVNMSYFRAQTRMHAQTGAHKHKYKNASTHHAPYFQDKPTWYDLWKSRLRQCVVHPVYDGLCEIHNALAIKLAGARTAEMRSQQLFRSIKKRSQTRA